MENFFVKKDFVVINPSIVGYHVLTILIIITTEVASGRSTFSLVKKCTKLTSVNPTPAGKNDIEPNKVEENTMMVVKIISKLRPNAVKTKYTNTASILQAAKLISQL